MEHSPWFSQSRASGQEYERQAVKDHDYFVEVKSRHFLRIARRIFGSLRGKTFLDVGCGSGEATQFLSQECARVVALDAVPGMMVGMTRLKENVRVQAVAGDAGQAPLKECSFDAAVAFNIFHHVPSEDSLRRILAEMARMVRPGGIVAVVELNPYNLVSRHVIRTCPIDVGVNLDGFHKGVFPTTLFPRELKRLFEDSGLSVMSMEYCVFFPKVLKVLLPLERWLRKVPFGGLYMVVGKVHA